LHIAAKAGDLAIVNYLVKNGSNLNAKDVRPKQFSN
jgi:ankyrin repeat protein